MLADIFAAISDGLERGFIGGLELVCAFVGLVLAVSVVFGAVAGGIWIGKFLL